MSLLAWVITALSPPVRRRESAADLKRGQVTTACAWCGAPVPDGVGERVGAVRFCGRLHIAEWYSVPLHDRRRTRVYAPVERRGA